MKSILTGDFSVYFEMCKPTLKVQRGSQNSIDFEKMPLKVFNLEKHLLFI